MPNPAKILHHVKRLAAALSVSTATESDIDLLIKTLTSTYREYALEPVQKLRQAVSQALLSVICNTNVQEGKVMSLNQMVTSQHRGTASKRQRPAESEENLSDSDTAIGAGDYFQLSNTGSRNSPHKSTADAYGDNSRSIEIDASNGAQNSSNGNAESTPKNTSSSASSSRKNKGRNRNSTSIAENSSSNHEAVSGNNVEDNIVGAIMSKGRSRASEFVISRPDTRLSDMAGIDSITSQVKELVFYPVLYPNLYNYLGVQPPCGLLLHGPSGCGKTSLAYAIAGELGLPFFKASGPELIGGTSGESEERIREIFLAASAAAPSVLFIDALDVIAGKKDSSQRGMDRRIVAQLFDSIDGIIRLGEDNLRSVDDPTANNGFASSPSKSSISSLLETDGVLSRSKGAPKKGLVVLIAATNK
jgi:SpoVK/Ycf46/Vps4 family AAA+-type ATPase